jgi:hypothetical protein
MLKLTLAAALLYGANAVNTDAKTDKFEDQIESVGYNTTTFTRIEKP